MAEVGLNRLVEGLRNFCSDHVLEEKLLLAPSRRIGFQWLDAVTRSGQPVLNARVTTMVSMALELAAPEMERRGAVFAGGIRTEVLMDKLVARLREPGGPAKGSLDKYSRDGDRYISRLDASNGLVRIIAATLRDLRLAGMTSSELSPPLFEGAVKGRELAYLLAGYEDELSSCCLMDYADVLRAAAERIVEDTAAIPEGVFLVLPENMEGNLRWLERTLWETIPHEKRIVLEVDHHEEPRGGDLSDAALLAWISSPSEAPPPRGDGTAEIFRAVGEVNEIREVLRRCVGRGIHLDEVEILHCDAATYIPLVHELCCSHMSEPGGPVPVTFSEGIPVRYSRPGRALAGWLFWIREGYPQSVLVDMIRDGLLEIEDAKLKGWGFTRLASVLRSIPIGAGKGRYPAAIDAALSALKRQADQEDGACDFQRLEMLRSLRGLVAGLLECIPENGINSIGLLKGAALFLHRLARSPVEFDAYGRERLIDEIAELIDGLKGEDPSCLNVMDWLLQLAHSSRVVGKGPRPGCLYVAPLESGGHSGRAHTFIVGLDDSRFPGAGLQDPLLLDSERERISAELPTASGRKAEVLEGFSALMARIRGAVTLGYCCRSLDDDRDLFPSPAVLSAYRILSGNREGLQDDLLRWLPPPVSFAPQGAEGCIDPAEWWLHRLCGDQDIALPEPLLAQVFPHLGRGREARRARESIEFTEYDGYVPEAGEDLDPTGPDGPVLSASRLEKLGKCPLEYFFQYVLGIEAPQEQLPDPSRWLEPTEKGSLLHSVFREFLCRLRREDLKPELERDWNLLQEILDMEISTWCAKKPPPNREILEGEAEELYRTARIFLQEEERFCRDRRPLYFEASIGLEAQGDGNPIDTPEPALIELPGGKTIRARGRIDRVDEVESAQGQCFSVCDYKTGSTWGYKRGDPFRQGRRVQNAIYLALAESRLADCHPGGEVVSFEYFFPNTKEHGERIRWAHEDLDDGRAIIGELCEMMARGSFPFTDDPEDVENSEYLPAFGEIDRAAAATRAKLANPRNVPLAPFRRLRGYEELEEDG